MWERYGDNDDINCDIRERMVISIVTLQGDIYMYDICILYMYDINCDVAGRASRLEAITHCWLKREQVQGSHTTISGSFGGSIFIDLKM